MPTLLARADLSIPEPRRSPDDSPTRSLDAGPKPGSDAGPRRQPDGRQPDGPSWQPDDAEAPGRARHRSVTNPRRRPVGRSLVGALTVLGAVGGIELAAGALLGDQGTSSPIDPATSPSALSSPQAAAPALDAAPIPAAPAPTPIPAPVPGAVAAPPIPVPSPPGAGRPGDPPARNPGAATQARSPGCVAPAGMSALLDQDPTDEQVPWRRAGAGRVPIYFAVGGMPADWRRDMEFGAAQWNKSPCVDTRVVNTCPSGSNCVTVAVVGKGDDGNFDAVEQGGFTTGGHITLLNTLTTNERKNVAVHEMGHAIGLKHRKTAKVLMNGDTYDDVFTPDPTEYRNLLFDYGRQHPGGAGQGGGGND